MIVVTVIIMAYSNTIFIHHMSVQSRGLDLRVESVKIL